MPVFANGDIIDAFTAKQALADSGADGVMVGRGSQGRPWQLAKIAAELSGVAPPAIPNGAARAEMIIEHYHDMLSFYGLKLGGRNARKHLGWYLDDVECPADLRREIMTQANVERIPALIATAMSFPERAAA